MRKRLYAITFAVLLFLNWEAAVTDAAALTIEKTLTETDGLASNTVLAIFEDSRGGMWFGTAAGLTRYDGERFQTFTTEDGLSEDMIGLIFEDPHGRLWFGDGVLPSLLEREKTVDMSWMEKPLSELDITPAGEIPSGIRKPIRLKGVSRYDGEAFRIFTTADGLAYDTVKDIVADETGTLWFATGAGVSRYDGEKFDNIVINGPMGMEVLPDWWNEITAIARDTAGNFWLGSTAGITYYNVQTSRFRHFGVDEDFAPFQEMGKVGTAHLTDLQFDAKQNLWMSQEAMGTENAGIRRYDGKKLTTFPQSKELPMNSVYTITRDSKGNLWFTGVKKLTPTLNETQESLSMVYPEVASGVSVYNGETFQNFNTVDGLPSDRVWSVYEDSKGKLWFATDSGVAIGVYLSSQNSSN